MTDTDFGFRRPSYVKYFDDLQYNFYIFQILNYIYGRFITEEDISIIYNIIN